MKQRAKELEISLSYNRNLQAALRNLHLVNRRLDGNPVTLSQQEQTGWERWKTGVKRGCLWGRWTNRGRQLPRPRQEQSNENGR